MQTNLLHVYSRYSRQRSHGIRTKSPWTKSPRTQSLRYRISCSISCSRPRTLVDVRQSSSAGRLTFGCINICSLNNKVDDLLEVRRDLKIDVLCLAETWHDQDSICFRRLRSDGYQIVDRPRPRLPSESSTMSINHGGVAIVAVPGVHLSAITLDFEPYSFELVCARIAVESFSCIIAVIYRRGSVAVTSTFFDDLSELLNRAVSYRDPIYIVGDVNVRSDRADDPDARRLTELFSVYDFAICVAWWSAGRCRNSL